MPWYRLFILSRMSMYCGFLPPFPGTQQHLKSKYGEGFKIDVMYHSGERDKADAFVTSSIPEAKLTMSNEGYLSYQVPSIIRSKIDLSS